MTATETDVRRDLAAAFRWTARLGWHEAVANHFSAAVSADGSQFLLNPCGRHFSRMRASELLLLDAARVGDTVDEAADATAWYLHANLHQRLPHARVVLHTHQPYATALACLHEFELLMLDQNSCRFFERVAYDHAYGGMFLDDGEADRVISLMGADKRVLFLGGHGVMVIGESVAEAFDALYYLEHAARLQVLALSTGRPLQLISDEVAARTRDQWEHYPAEAARLHFDELKAILDEDDPSYAS
ncbi:MAG: class II aldolase/adducin family protein [Ilumatobacteraceae bacterium]